MRLVSSNTNQLMPAAGATLARLGKIPCAGAWIPQGTHGASLEALDTLQLIHPD